MVGPAIRGRHGAAIGDGRRRTDRVFEQKHRIIGRNRAAIIQRDGGYICAIAFQVNRPIANRLNGARRGVCQADGIIANIGNANGVIAFDRRSGRCRFRADTYRTAIV